MSGSDSECSVDSGVERERGFFGLAPSVSGAFFAERDLKLFHSTGKERSKLTICTKAREGAFVGVTSFLQSFSSSGLLIIFTLLKMAARESPGMREVPTIAAPQQQSFAVRREKHDASRATIRAGLRGNREFVHGRDCALRGLGSRFRG